MKMLLLKCQKCGRVCCLEATDVRPGPYGGEPVAHDNGEPLLCPYGHGGGQYWLVPVPGVREGELRKAAFQSGYDTALLQAKQICEAEAHRVEKLLSHGDEWTASDAADRLRECAEDIQELRNA